MSPPSALPRAALPMPPAPRLCEVLQDDPCRAEVEAFIHGVFLERFGAHVRGFAPVLVALRDDQDRLLAAAGYRAADSGPLFLERYLEQPIERHLQAASGAPVARARIAEVGHLAAVQAGEGRRLVGLMGLLLAEEGFDWIVSTLTKELRQLFVRLGVAPLALGVADPERLGEQAGDWGSYYDHRPLVHAGQLQLALQAMQRRSRA